MNNKFNNIRIINYGDNKKYLVSGYFIFKDEQDNKIIAVNDISSLNVLKDVKFAKTFIKNRDFYKCLEQNFAHLNIIKAQYFLEFLSNNVTAKNIEYTRKIIFSFSVFLLTYFYLPTIFHLANNLIYFSQNSLKMILFIKAILSFSIYEVTPVKAGSCYISADGCRLRDNLRIQASFKEIATQLYRSLRATWMVKVMQQNFKAGIYDKKRYSFLATNLSKYDIKEDIPIYTILIPLYKEIGKLRSIINNISLLDYPKDKLDVKILLEADDYLMIKEITLHDLPSYFHILIVPTSFPRTKPKALNYGLEYSRGKYLVVYDAEDIPDPDQLFKALKAFKNLPSEYVCLQAKLSFYNKDENLLTKMFNIEYSLWFEYILKGLSLLALPVTLGGTSNHFKTDILRKIGGWDPYNVTEDAELGIRLYSNGYKVHMIDSYTLEEAPITVSNWLNQRSRWIKGFMQTFFVFQAQKDKYMKFNIRQVITIYIFIGLTTYSFCCMPFIIGTIIINNNSFINYLWLFNSFFASFYLYGSAFYILKTCMRRKKIKFQDIIAFILWPGYFFLHTVASYKAMWEIIFKPFKWNKTKHGVSMQNFDKQ